jgi:hypothetical protein
MYYISQLLSALQLRPVIFEAHGFPLFSIITILSIFDSGSEIALAILCD